MNALHLLEFDRIRDRIAEHCRTSGGADLARELSPTDDLSVLEPTSTRVGALSRLLEEGLELPGTVVGEVETAIEAARVSGSVLDSEALFAVRRALDLALEWDGLLSALDDENAATDALREIYTPGVLPEELHRRLKAFIAADGTIHEEAIPEVARLRSQLLSIRNEIRATAAATIRGARDIYREDVPTIRDGRTVLPLRADYKGRVDGIIHETSGSGDTLFVEPSVLVDLNNAGVRAEAEIHAEIHRHLRELSAAVRSEVETIARIADAVIELDLLAARARYGSATRGRIAPRRETIELHGARHPLLGDACVPLHIKFSPGTRLLVISGPNTGGKTVLLKTLGLLAVMNQSSIPIPVEADSGLPVFSDFAISIGDEQSIDEALSTFSAHVRSLAEIAMRAGRNSLVLLDELAAGTDPEEGAALAMALIDHLLELGATMLVTTHLTVLKHYGYTRPNAANASMEFDETTHLPTYRVVPGRPGSSHALDTARRFGLPEEVLARADGYLADRAGSVGEIIRRLEEQEREQRELGESLRVDREQLDRLRSELAARETTLDEREITLRRDGIRELERDLARARADIEAEVRRLRERYGSISDEEVRGAQSILREAEAAAAEQRETISRLERGRPAADDALSAEEITAGMRLRHRRTAKTGVVRSVRGAKAELQFDTLRMTVPIDELQRVREDNTPEPSIAIDANAARSAASAKFELDLRGFRLAEALEALEDQIDAALLQHLTRFSVIHGTGTGALRKGVHEYLRDRSEIASFDFAPADQGGFGKTVVELVRHSG